MVLSLPARAASYCYETQGFPSIRALEPLADGFRAYLDAAEVYPQPKVATLIYSEAQGWRKGEARKPPPPIYVGRAQDSCGASIPRGYELTLEQARELSPSLRENNYQFEIEQKPFRHAPVVEDLRSYSGGRLRHPG